MACRKAAYRALTEVSEWKQQQDEKAAAVRAALEAEMRKVWTLAPAMSTCDDRASIDCCMLWLKDGLEKGPQCGCSGACGKEHPRIRFTFSKEEQSSRATLSHALDPFVDYFDGLCGEGLATKHTPTTYYLKGFLQFHVQKLKNKASFGFHLLKVSTVDLSLSKRTHERQLEKEDEMARLIKKQKRTKEALVEGSLIEKVLEVMYQTQWLSCEIFDLVDLAWIRLACRALNRMATRLISEKMSEINLSYSVVVNDQPNPETRRPGEGRLQQKGPSHVSRYTVLTAQRRLVPKTNSKDKVAKDGSFSYSNTSTEYWCPGREPPRLSFDQNHGIIESKKNLGRLVRVYLDRPSKHSTHSLRLGPENITFFPTSTSPPLEVARYQIAAAQQEETVLLSEGSSDKISNVTVTPTINDDESGSSPIDLSSDSIRFDFGDLLGIFVRKKLRKAKQAMGNRGRTHPATPEEKEYVRALAKAARRSPGTASTFEGYQGW